MLLAIESSAASIASAWISAAALVAVVVFGVLNLRRSAQGAVGSAKWQLQHVNGAQYELLQVGSAPAYGVTVTVDGETPFDGKAEFAVFEVSQRAVYAILTTDQTGLQAVDDVEKGWSPAHAVAADVGAGAIGLGAGLGVAAAAAAGTVSAPVAAVAIGAGAIAVGVGDFAYQAFHEHWSEDIHDHGVIAGVLDGIGNSGARVGDDAVNVATDIGQGAKSLGESLWHGLVD